MRTPLLLPLALLFPLPLFTAENAAPKPRASAEILSTSPASDWRTPDPANLLYLQLDTGRVIIELAPAFAPEHVGNIRTLAHERFWDGSTVYRVVDDFVAQFGDADDEDPAKARSLGSAKRHLPAEFHRDAKGLDFAPIPDSDGWAPRVGFVDSLPVAMDDSGKAWIAHCYGVVGAARDNADDSSLGAELYVVIGQSPRRLDDNLSVVGRVLQGMELLSPIRRGPPDSGRYANAADRTPIRSVRLASEVPEAERAPLKVLRTSSATFRELLDASRRGVNDFYKRPNGRVDLCSISVPVRLQER